MVTKMSGPDTYQAQPVANRFIRSTPRGWVPQGVLPVTLYARTAIMPRPLAAATTGNPGMGFNLETGDASCIGTNGDYGFTSFTATAT